MLSTASTSSRLVHKTLAFPSETNIGVSAYMYIYHVPYTPLIVGTVSGHADAFGACLCDLRHSEAGHTMTSVQSNVNRLVVTKDGARSTVMIQECPSDPADIRPCIRDPAASVYVVMQSLNLLSLSRFTLGLDHPIHALLIKNRLLGYPLLSKLDHRPNQILPLHSSLH